MDPRVTSAFAIAPATRCRHSLLAASVSLGLRPQYPSRISQRRPRIRSPHDCITSTAQSVHSQLSSKPEIETAADDGRGAQPRTLYIVSTPIGNSGDITARAIRILGTADVIAAEDTRRTGLLLQRVVPGGRAKSSELLSCHAHNWKARAPEVVRRLGEGQSVAVVSDAGTPCVSDPGAEIASAALAAGFRVVPVPGACAALAALVVAAVPSGVEFVVVGFVPRSGRRRAECLDRIHGVYKEAAIVLYEAPHRLRETLADLAALERGNDDPLSFDTSASFRTRTVCLGREVTKRYEEFLHYSSTVDASLAHTPVETGGGGREPRGEYTIVLGPSVIPSSVADDKEADDDGRSAVELELVAASCDVRPLIVSLIRAGTPISVISKSVSSTSNLSRKAVYTYASRVKEALSGRSSI
jgi:16S rRNA (cytidine1402-2'-O)-methyltransferase